jgi:hypothetical protein
MTITPQEVVQTAPPEPVENVDVETVELTGLDAFAQKIADEVAALRDGRL